VQDVKPLFCEIECPDCRDRFRIVYRPGDLAAGEMCACPRCMRGIKIADGVHAADKRRKRNLPKST
jgi:hypothetical protein